MICKNCGNEMSNESVFCNKCGAKIEEAIEKYETIQESHSVSDETNTKSTVNNGNKKKIVIIVVVAVVVVIIISALFGGGNDYQGSGNNQPQTEDSFGANNVTVTQPQTTEAITAAPIDIEVIYPEIVTDKHRYGAKIKIKSCDVTRDTSGQYKFMFTVEKVCGSENKGYKNFVANIYFYDAAGNLLDSKQALYLRNFDDEPNGKEFRCTEVYYSNSHVGELAKVEIVGG